MKRGKMRDKSSKNSRRKESIDLKKREFLKKGVLGLAGIGGLAAFSKLAKAGIIFRDNSYQSTKSGFTIGTPQVTTSGDDIDFTGIPTGTNFIILHFNEVSLSGTDGIHVVLGDAGGFETTSYNQTGILHVDATAANGNATATAFVAAETIQSAAYRFSGHMILALENSSSFTWTMSVEGGHTGTDTLSHGAGSKSLSAELTQIRVSTSGANTFDAGEVNIMYQ